MCTTKKRCPLWCTFRISTFLRLIMRFQWNNVLNYYFWSNIQKKIFVQYWVNIVHIAMYSLVLKCTSTKQNVLYLYNICLNQTKDIYLIYIDFNSTIVNHHHHFNLKRFTCLHCLENSFQIYLFNLRRIRFFFCTCLIMF